MIVPASPCAARVVPLQLAGHFPLITVQIGETDVPLIFDSGDASTVALRRSVLDHIGAEPTGETFIGSDRNGQFSAPKYQVPRVKIGQTVFKNVIARMDVHEPDTGHAGWLGTGLFKSHQLVLDYPHRTLTLLPNTISGNDATSGNDAESGHDAIVPFLPGPSGNDPTEPLTEADTDFGRVALWWATASAESVVSRRSVAHASRHVFRGDTLLSRQFMLGGTDFGPHRFLAVEMALPPFFDGLLGYEFFAAYSVCFDFVHKRVVVRR